MTSDTHSLDGDGRSSSRLSEPWQQKLEAGLAAGETVAAWLPAVANQGIVRL
jgi:hypothetical protein